MVSPLGPKATNSYAPSPHRPAIRGINSRSRTCFPIILGQSIRPARKTGSETKFVHPPKMKVQENNRKPPRARGANGVPAGFRNAEIGKPPRSRGEPRQFCPTPGPGRETPALTGRTLTTQYKLSFATRKPFQQAISLLPTFIADINAAENIRRQGLLILTKRHGKGSAPSPHRPAIQGTNSRSRAHFPRQTRILYGGYKKRPQRSFVASGTQSRLTTRQLSRQDAVPEVEHRPQHLVDGTPRKRHNHGRDDATQDE